MSLNSQTQPISIQQLRKELMGRDIRPANKKVETKRVSVGQAAPFDAFHFFSVATMTIVVALCTSVIGAVVIGLSGFTLEKAGIAALACIAFGMIAAAIADWATPESKVVQRERIRRQKAAMKAR